MFDLSKDIRSLSDFKRDTSSFMRRLHRSGHPLVLTVNGKARLVVQDAAAYQQLLELASQVETIEGIREGLAAFARGEGIPALDALDAIRKKHGIPRTD